MIWVTTPMLQPSKSRSGFGNGDRSIDGEVCLHWIAYTLRYRPNLIPPAICSPVPFSGRTGGISVLRRSVPSVLPAGTALWTAIPSSSTEKNAASSLNAQPTVLPAVSAVGSSPPKSKSIKQHPVLFYPLKVSSWGSERPEKCPVGEALRTASGRYIVRAEVNRNERAVWGTVATIEVADSFLA